MFKGEATKGICLASKCKRMEKNKSLQILKFGNPLESMELLDLVLRIGRRRLARCYKKYSQNPSKPFLI